MSYDKANQTNLREYEQTFPQMADKARKPSERLAHTLSELTPEIYELIEKTKQLHDGR